MTILRAACPGAVLVLGMALGAGGAALADEPDPGICPVAPSTITFDLGAYRGAYTATYAGGRKLGHSGWQSCGPAPEGRETSLDGCAFSLCDLPDGDYEIRLADAPAPPAFRFKAVAHQIQMGPSPLGAKVAFYGVDATGSHRKLTLDLQGYALKWSIAHWPGPFTGGDTHRRAVAQDGKLVFSLYPTIPYRFRFGAADASITLGLDGAVAAGAGGAIAVRDGGAVLRVARLRIVPPAPGAWSIDDTDMKGGETVSLPAGAVVTLRQGAAMQNLSLDASCHPGASAGPFKVEPAPAADLARTCP